MTEAKRREGKSTICFRGKLAPGKKNAETERWTLTLPKSASARLPSRGVTTVEGMINQFPFRAALEPDGKQSHWLMVSREMRAAAGIEGGGEVTVEITRAGEEPEIRVPADLEKALKASRVALAGWADITPMARRDWIFSITSAKQAETRQRRIAKACDMLACGKRRLCCFPGVKWLMRENAKSCGMWVPLDKSAPVRRKEAEPGKRVARSKP